MIMSISMILTLDEMKMMLVHLMNPLLMYLDEPFLVSSSARNCDEHHC